MFRKGVGEFKYFVGISSLAQIATREDRVCVLNILGGESSDVTPVGHAYSGGNVVFGTSPGRRGQVLETPIGNVPVYNNVLEGLNEGHRFNCGVIYLPPSAARDGVAELIRVNPDLKKIYIVTEKLSVHDSREIRAMGQQNGIDIFGGNSLGVADAWNKVRIGGALGGDSPAEALRKGSIAIFSNSGNFTTTIATYLRMAGWGTTTLISSGKDVYIHFAAPEWAFALANDARSKAAVMYVEPGGYYEYDAEYTKPIVACVVGRWKSKLTRAVGHAGAMSGGSDDAAGKERWFMDKFGVDGIFTPEKPVFSAKGAVVTNIAHIPLALSAVMRENATRPDFAPEGNLALKPWFGSNRGLDLPPVLDVPVVEATPPYNEQIAALNEQIGALLPRQSMKDTSGASQMDAKTQVTSLHGVSMLEAAQYPMEANVCLALLHEPGGENDRKLVNVAIGAELNLHGDATLAAAQASREAGNAPNSVLAAAASIVGPRRQDAARRALRELIEQFAKAGLEDARTSHFDLAKAGVDCPRAVRRREAGPESGRDAGRPRGARRAIGVRALSAKPRRSSDVGRGARGHRGDARLGPADAQAHLQADGGKPAVVAAPVRHDDRRLGGRAGSTLPKASAEFPLADLLGKRSLTEVACVALIGQEPTPGRPVRVPDPGGPAADQWSGRDLRPGREGRHVRRRPGGAGRVQFNKALVGFLTHSGYAHGGNGYEGVAFLLERFKGVDLADPSDPKHGLDLKAMATEFARRYGEERIKRKEMGAESAQALPCINHPVFKGKPVNIDPREEFIRNLFAQRGEYNVFHDYYRTLVQVLYDENVTRNVFCVNVDAVIATLLLKMLWQRYRDGTFSERALETAAFTVFLYGRMLGCAAEIDDHLNRGKNMDTRTPQADIRFVA